MQDAYAGLDADANADGHHIELAVVNHRATMPSTNHTEFDNAQPSPSTVKIDGQQVRFRTQKKTSTTSFADVAVAQQSASLLAASRNGRQGGPQRKQSFRKRDSVSP